MTTARKQLRRLPADVPPELLVVLAAASVQIGASQASLLFATYGAVTVVTLRLVFGALLVDAVRAPRFRGTSRRAWQSALLLGAILAGMNTAFYLAIERLPLGVVVTIEFVGPLAAAVLGSRRPIDLAWVALAATGVVLLAGPRVEAMDLLGLGAAVATGFGWFLYILAGARVSRDWPDGRGVGAAMSIAALLILPVGLAFGNLGAVAAAPSVLLIGLVIALFSSAIPYTFDVAALGRIRPETYGILVSLEPAFGAIAGYLFLAQALSVAELVAVGLVTVASIGASLTARPLAEAPGA